MQEKLNEQSAQRHVEQPLETTIPRRRAEHADSCTDADFWDAFPPDESETLPEAGDFWMEAD